MNNVLVSVLIGVFIGQLMIQITRCGAFGPECFLCRARRRWVVWRAGRRASRALAAREAARRRPLPRVRVVRHEALAKVQSKETP